MAVAGSPESWVGQRSTRRHWNLVEEGPPSPVGNSTLKLENRS
jgi:hypothetical protein